QVLGALVGESPRRVALAAFLLHRDRRLAFRHRDPARRFLGRLPLQEVRKLLGSLVLLAFEVAVAVLGLEVQGFGLTVELALTEALSGQRVVARLLHFACRHLVRDGRADRKGRTGNGDRVTHYLTSTRPRLIV